ncbi:extensin family protein [Serratia sp. AKBS12]|uniref:extensin-like domain-containing protein n=1 Tax=Serratia sp. AKBS12 TaxID=2974597 RepID=UPI002165B421|nr:extensin family protein [Serratia sp. AKBS12]MCS3409125.1 extensin family protein [Serratia sp. AKBS12]HEI8865451.1 extensin family protein [Serratia odorifera]
MQRWGMVILIVLVIAGSAPWWLRQLPPGYNPFSPLSVNDPPTFMTRLKLQRLADDPQACIRALAQARDAGYVAFRQVADVTGDCPLVAPIRVQSFGQVKLSSSFLASCPLALSSTMFVTQVAAPLAQRQLGTRLTRIDHLGSYACRNIYHRPAGRLSEHATADAWDVSGFRMANGQRLRIEKQWSKPTDSGIYLRTVFNDGCGFFGNALGPEYNAAHANHFHLAMRGLGSCG